MNTSTTDHRPSSRLLRVVALVAFALPVLAVAAPRSAHAAFRPHSDGVHTAPAPAPVQVAHLHEEPIPELQPAYEPVPPKKSSGYNSEYLFGMTRAVAGSTMHPAVRVLCFPVTVPLDLALLPFEFVGGFFQ